MIELDADLRSDWCRSEYYLEFMKKSLYVLHDKPQKDWTKDEQYWAEYYRKNLRSIGEWRYAILRNYK